VEPVAIVVEEEIPAKIVTRERWLVIGLSAAVVILSITTAFLFWSNQKVRNQTNLNPMGKPDPVYQNVWGDFLKDTEPTLVIIGNPLVYRLANPMDPQLENG